jgi:hypothetical protein
MFLNSSGSFRVAKRGQSQSVVKKYCEFRIYSDY